MMSPTNISLERESNSGLHQNQTPFPFLDSLCRVCRSVSTGVHYGVSTCEGCKGFFKRSIPKSQHYKCYFGGDCEITKETRNRCKCCRFQRCLQVGMALEAVKMGRIPKGERERALKLTDQHDNGMRSLKPIAPAPCSFSTPFIPLPVISRSSTASSNKEFVFTSIRPTSNTGLLPSTSAPSYRFPLPKNRSHNQQTPTDGLVNKRKYDAQSGPGFSAGRSDDTLQMTGSPHLIRTTLIGRACEKMKSEHDVGSPNISNVKKNLLDHLMLPAFSPIFTVPDADFGDSFGQPDNAAAFPGQEVSCMSGGIFSNSYLQTSPLRRMADPNSKFQPDESAYNRSLSAQLADIDTSSRHVHLHSDYRYQTYTAPPTKDSFYRSTDQRIYMSAVDNRDSHIHQKNKLRKGLSRDAFSPCLSSVSSEVPEQSLNAGDSGFESRSTSVMTSYSCDTDSPSQSDGRYTTGYSLSGHELIRSNNGTWLEMNPFIPKQEPMEDWRIPSHVSANNAINDLLYEYPSRQLTDRHELPSPRVTIEEENRTLEDIVKIIDDAGNEIYREETLNSVEFMVRMWHEGCLSQKPHENETCVTAVNVRDCLKRNVGVIVGNVFSFSAKIPGFSELCGVDVKLLLGDCVFEIWLLQSAAFLVNNESYLMLPSGNESIHYTRSWMSQFLPEIMINALMTFSDEINSYQLSSLELNILKAVVIVCPDRDGLEDSTTVKNLRMILLKALHCAYKRRQDSPSEEMFCKITDLIPYLARVNELNKKHIEPIDMSKESGWKLHT